MSLQGAALGAVVALVALGGAALWVYNAGDSNGAARIQGQWDKAVNDAEAETARVRGEGYALAAEYEAQLHEAEARYAKTNAQLRRALSRPAVCPASGRVGDIVLPAELVDSMFNRERVGAGAPGPSASQPDAALR